MMFRLLLTRVIAALLLLPACDRELNAGSSFPAPDGGGEAAVLPSLVTNGTARIDNGVLILTPDEENHSGSAFLPQPIAWDGTSAISVRVAFRITVTSIAADGFAVVMQATEAGVHALGGVGGGIGYGGFSPSVAVEVDTHDELGGVHEPPHLAVVVDGDNHAATAQTPGLPLDPADGRVHTLWVRFARDRVDAWLADGDARPATPLLTASVPVRSHFTVPVWLGLTAATGAKYARHEVLDFAVTVEP